ncbi:tigger transposable element-derived protein 7-like [Limulus polyphemus]|uniref:Tigger transposable element-derived protein 7-like n=1 Tax=Limulus polyphemus TaxID=6850 RepID=A0ABM1BSN5_LIMPO|nr:tigger transposable element-derived protein 7-like [Limulus polyphemus]
MASRSYRKGLKLKSLSLKEKIKVLERMDVGASMHNVCEEFGIKTSTFSDIKKSGYKIKVHALSLEDSSSSNKTQKRINPAKYSNWDQAVYKWYKQELPSGINIRGVDIQNAAASLAQDLNNEGFTASSGWLFHIWARLCLVNRKVAGKSASSDHNSVEPLRKWVEKVMGDLQLLMAQLYNRDKTCLFWKAVPTNTHRLLRTSPTYLVERW